MAHIKVMGVTYLQRHGICVLYAVEVLLD